MVEKYCVSGCNARLEEGEFRRLFNVPFPDARKQETYAIELKRKDETG